MCKCYIANDLFSLVSDLIYSIYLALIFYATSKLEIVGISAADRNVNMSMIYWKFKI